MLTLLAHGYQSFRVTNYKHLSYQTFIAWLLPNISELISRINPLLNNSDGCQLLIQVRIQYITRNTQYAGIHTSS